MVEDEDLLLAVLNSAPVVDGRPTDTLAERVRELGGRGTRAECARLRQVRDALQQLIRGASADTAALDAALDAARLRPEVSAAGVTWCLDAPPDDVLAVRTVRAWSRVLAELPHRLRPCANDACNLFLVDHSRPGTARWCSMSTCGNRAKARTHARRRGGTGN